MLKKHYSLVLTLLISVSILALICRGKSSDDTYIDQCIDSLPSYKPTLEVSGTIDVWGHGSFKHDFMGRLMTEWIREFTQFHPSVTFKNHLYGTASAIGALSTGAGNLAILGEEISPSALEAFKREKGYEPKKFDLATGSIDINYFDYAHMIFVHKNNPLTELSLDQLEAIFGSEHKLSSHNIRSWSELGLGSVWKQKPIHLYSWRVDEDFGLFFRERVLLGSHRWNPSIVEFTHLIRSDGSQYDQGQRIVDHVASDPYSIGISNIRYSNQNVKILALSRKTGEKSYLPTKENLITQNYPLVRIIPLYVDQESSGKMEPQLEEFIKYILSKNGQKALIEFSDYLPINPSIALKQIHELK